MNNKLASGFLLTTFAILPLLGGCSCNSTRTAPGSHERASADERMATAANNDFGFDLYRQLAKQNPDGNLFLSPFSVTSTLAMSLEGARGETAEEMGTMLRLPEEIRREGDGAQTIPWKTNSLHGGLGTLSRRFNAVDSTCELSIANALWGEKSHPFQQSYVDTINEYYDTESLQKADFINDPDGERQRINQWVADKTNGHIEDVLPEGEINSDTRLVLTNAIYFKGQWAVPFEDYWTDWEDFTRSDGTTVETVMMQRMFDEKVRYVAIHPDGSVFHSPANRDSGKPLYPEDGFMIVELPYSGGRLSMILLAPRNVDGLPAIEELLTSGNLASWTSELQRRDVFVLLPKFEMNTEYDLANTLPELGMTRAFEPARADFSGTSKNDDLFVSAARHKTFVAVDELGTVAAATTYKNEDKKSDGPSQAFIPRFNADRPFIFLIRDKATNCVLFVGRMTTPTKLRPRAEGATD
jgi:serpin B